MNLFELLFVLFILKWSAGKSFSSNLNQLKDTCDIHYFNLPYITTKIWILCKEFHKRNVNIKLVFTSSKTKNYFSYKDPIPDYLKFSLVYNITSASSSATLIIF